MRPMSAEKVIKILNSIGAKVYVFEGEIAAQGGNLHNLPNSHPMWRLIKIHYSILCKHFGVPE